MTPRKFLLLSGVGPLLALFQCAGLLAAARTLGVPPKLDALAWTTVGSLWWGLTVPFIVYWSERQPLVLDTRLRSLLPVHLLRALALSVASGLGIWASHALAERWLGTPNYSMRLMWSKLFQSWLLFDLFLYAVVLSVVSALANQRQLRQKELDAARLETSLARTEIKLLKAELDPHFVFNALHTISSLVHRDPAAADRMISRLSDFLRLSLASTGAQEVTLQQELDHLRSYMEVQMVRFRGRLSLVVDVPTPLLSCLVPNLLLQPLIENVVKHAVAVGLKPVQATVRARQEGAELRLEIADDGPGLAATPGHGRREGIGLANTRARLQKLYGPGYALTLEDRFGGGTRALVRLPFRRDENALTSSDEEFELLEETPDVARFHR